MPTVHVRIDGECHPAVVLARGGGDLLLLRVYSSTPRTAPLGSQDTEGWYRYWTEALTVPNPAGGTRRLDGWHELDICRELAPEIPDHTWDGLNARMTP